MINHDMRRIRALLFDKDGTLIDFEKTWFPASHTVLTILANGNAEHLAKIEDYLLYDPKTKRYAAHSPLIAEAGSTYCPIFAEILGRDSASVLEDYDRLCLVEGLKNTVPILNPLKILTALKNKGYILGLATNGSQALGQGHSDILEITPLLDFICGYDSGFGKKPQGGMVTGFANAVKVKPHEIAVIGDTLHDIHMAKHGGAVSIGIASGLTPYNILAAEADMMADDLEHLLTLF